MLTLWFLVATALFVSQCSAQFEFNLDDVLAKLRNTTAPPTTTTKRADQVTRERRQATGAPTAALPQPCGGRDTYPPIGICMPFTLMTEDAVTAPGAGKRVVIVGGSRGIGVPLANTRKAQGAAVTATSREWNPVQRAIRRYPPLEGDPLLGALSAGIVKEELDYGLDYTTSPKSPVNFIRRDMRRNNNTLADEYYLVGNNADSGNPEDYDDDDAQYMDRVHYSGWRSMLKEISKYRKLPQNANRTISITFLCSGGALAITPGVLDWYYGGHKMKRDYVLHQNNKQLMKPSATAPQNFVFSVMYAFFVNSTYWKYIRNPSADKGDRFQQQYANVTRDFTLTYGNAPQGVANALIRIGSGQMGAQRHFVMPPRSLPPPAPFIDWTAGSFRTIENNFGDPLMTLAQIGGWAYLGAQVNQHGSYELPAYGVNDC